MIRFSKSYFAVTIALLLIEVFIALFIHDAVIRPYIGDFLVVILLYCFVRSFLNTSILVTAICVLLFSYVVETAQYFKFVEVLGLSNSRLAKIIIGTSFEWTDLLAYTAGILCVLLFEKLIAKKQLLRNTVK
ncbi:ribosomal maturation YjgA family protein [Ferruginibacter albus]|uniref:ribosomal maturation YjgA family protein n=1 Tax=Ferruginibacter albus TaxID=2875540 RepID=UPI001CC650F5|nr:DUF2809 domain-containing protein [Ferruginibacter albus]UAY51020.1 DUF2809 domain-containing protein [Ferruginibacter albus]